MVKIMATTAAAVSMSSVNLREAFMKKGVQLVSRYLVLLICGFVIAAAGAAPARATQVVYSGWSGDGVTNDPTVDTVFTLTVPTNIAAIYNYHWNDGMGQDASQVGGTIGIDQISETESVVIGKWPATSWSTQPGAVTNTGWVAYPNILLGPGTYKVVDSDKATWSYSYGNYWGSGTDWETGKGFSHIEASAGVTATQPVNNAVNVALMQPVTITFSKEVLSGAIWDQIVNRDILASSSLDRIEISYLKNDGIRGIVPTTKTVSGSSVIITPIKGYRPNTVYTVNLPAGSVMDVMTFPSAPYQFFFKTANQ